MMRSKTSITLPTETTSPVSSSTSRAQACSSVSPSSTAPPGRFHAPFNGSCARLTSTIPPSWSTTAPTPTTGRSGYDRVRSVANRQPQSTIGNPIGNRQSNRQSGIPQSVNLQSAICSLQSDAHHLDDYTLAALAVELGVEHLLPGTEIQFAAGDRQQDLMAHDRPLQVRVGVVLARLMVLVRQARRRELLEPGLEVLDEPALPVVHVDARRDVHRRHQHHAVVDAALPDDRGDFVRNADELLALLRIEPEVVGKYLHCRLQTADCRFTN